jgi:hypothetical protein
MRLCDKAMHVVMSRRDAIRVLLRKDAKAGETEEATSCRKTTTYESGAYGFLSFVSNREKGDENVRNSLKRLVAGEGFEPSTFGL